jgi:hypothetical protein
MIYRQNYNTHPIQTQRARDNALAGFYVLRRDIMEKMAVTMQDIAREFGLSGAETCDKLVLSLIEAKVAPQPKSVMLQPSIVARESTRRLP